MHHRKRDARRILQSPLDINDWLARPPTVDEARPARCPCCGIASRPAGRPLGIWGHGLRSRLCQGPPSPGERPEPRGVLCRRYQCQTCDAVLLVVPRGVSRRKHYGASAIAWSLALLGVAGLTWKAVRQAVSVWPLPAGDVVSSWKTLRRWIGEVASGVLFTTLPQCPSGASPRQVAARAAMALAGHAPPSVRHLVVPDQAFFGGAQMA